MNPLTGLILAGGKSRRLGEDKRFLMLGGKTCIERVLAAYAGLFDEVIVVADAEEPLRSLGVRVVVDLIADRATLGGLYTGLSYATTDRVFAAAADMPFLSASTIRIVLEHAEQGDIVIPELKTKLQTMHAVYSKACLPHLKRLVMASRLKVRELSEIPGLKIHRIPESAFRAVDPELRSFFNINTPEDLAMARRWLGD